MLTAFIAMAVIQTPIVPPHPTYSRLATIERLPAFPEAGKQAVVSIDPIDPGFAWNEAIVSWNVDGGASASMTVEARVLREGHETKWYSLGRWTGDLRKAPRESVNNQKDDDANVLTDTLRLQQPGGKLELRLTLQTIDGQSVPRLKLLAVSFADTAAAPTPREPNHAAWGKVIEVPQRSQMDYESGKLKIDPAVASEDFNKWLATVKTSQYCSPTAVSMLLSHWAKQLKRPEIDKGVPDVVLGVFDKTWPGTGNWPFNTAYLGSMPGLLSYVTRLESTADLEDLILAGVPVATSVSYNLLQANGKPAGGDGHLLILVGFSPEGDPVFNDPGWSKQVRQTYKRANFDQAWAKSGRTVYLVYPQGTKLPKAADGCWISG